jgi:hypothetical protein
MDNPRRELVELAFSLLGRRRAIADATTPQREATPFHSEYFALRHAAETRRTFIKNTLANARAKQRPYAEWLANIYSIQERPHSNPAERYVLEWKVPSRRARQQED